MRAAGAVIDSPRSAATIRPGRQAIVMLPSGVGNSETDLPSGGGGSIGLICAVIAPFLSGMVAEKAKS